MNDGKKTPEGKLMVYVDARFHEDDGSGSTGVEICYSNGGFMAAASSSIKHLVDAPMAESYSLRKV